MAGNKQRPQGSGLIGALEAREREKKEIKEGYGGQMVQQAIAQRQQQAQQGYQYGNPQTQGVPTYARSPSPFGMPTGQFAQPVPQQQYYQGVAQTYAQTGGWSAPQGQYQLQQQRTRPGQGFQ
jgi:CCR4-NOT transcriptional complex subunit CAF120